MEKQESIKELAAHHLALQSAQIQIYLTYHTQLTGLLEIPQSYQAKALHVISVHLLHRLLDPPQKLQGPNHMLDLHQVMI